jgi:AcrR family transcriptional regulator
MAENLGLRARQKADRLGRILSAASARFRRLGYDATRIEDIAEEADVSVGTVYNYFRTKGDVLVAIVSLEVEEILDEGARLIAEGPDDPAAAVGQLIDFYYDHSLVYLSKDMWRTAMALSISSPETPMSARYTALDTRLMEQVCRLIASLQARGLLRPDVDGRAVGELLFNNLNMMFVEFVKDDNQTLAALKSRVAWQNGPLLASLMVTPL